MNLHKRWAVADLIHSMPFQTSGITFNYFHSKNVYRFMDMIAIDGKKERKPHQSKEEKNKNDSGRHFKMLPYVLSGYLHNIQISGCYVHSIFSSFYLSIHRSFIQQTKKKKEN